MAGWNIGPNDKAGVPLLVGLNDLLSGSDLGVHLPLNRLEGTGGGGPSFACIAFMLGDLAGDELMIAPHVGQCLQGGLRRFRRRKTFGMQVQQLLCDSVPFTLLCLSDARLGALHGSL